MRCQLQGKEAASRGRVENRSSADQFLLWQVSGGSRVRVAGGGAGGRSLGRFRSSEAWNKGCEFISERPGRSQFQLENKNVNRKQLVPSAQN